MSNSKLTTIILLCCAFVTAQAQDFITEDLGTTTTEFQYDLRDLFRSGIPKRMLRSRQQVEDADTAYNYRDRIANMPDYMNAFIDDFIEAGQTVLDGGVSWLSDPTKGEYESGAYYYLIDEVNGSTDFTFPAGSTNNTIKQAAQKAASKDMDIRMDTLKSFLPYAYLCANYDHPEFFWINNSFRFGASSSLKMSYSPSGSGTVDYTMKFRFILRSSDFDFRSNGVSGYDFRMSGSIPAGVTRFNEAKESILKQCASKRTTYFKLLAAHDWLTTHNCYNRFVSLGYGQEYVGNTPWSPISALEGNSNNMQSPVCEGYARALKVLCDEMGIPCILVGGIATPRPDVKPDAHMWNYVRMDDGKWYAVDVTWDDPSDRSITTPVSGYESHDWFLLGSSTQVAENFSFLDSHPEQWPNGYENSGTIPWETKPWPELSDSEWEPAPYDPNGDGVTDKEDIRLMARTIARNGDDIDDVDGNGRISVGDLVRLIVRYLSESEGQAEE